MLTIKLYILPNVYPDKSVLIHIYLAKTNHRQCTYMYILIDILNTICFASVFHLYLQFVITGFMNVEISILCFMTAFREFVYFFFRFNNTNKLYENNKPLTIKKVVHFTVFSCSNVLICPKST